MTEQTPEWILVAIAEANWVCLDRERPRTWCLAVDYAAITDTLEVMPRILASRVREIPGESSERIRHATKVAFRQSRQWLYNAAEAMLQDGRTGDGIKIRKIVPPAVATPYQNAQRAIRHAERDFDKTIEVIGDLRNPTRWGLRHLPTGTTVYFNVWKPFAAMAPQERHAMVDQAMTDLERAVRDRKGTKSRSMAPPALSMEAN